MDEGKSMRYLLCLALLASCSGTDGNGPYTRTDVFVANDSLYHTLEYVGFRGIGESTWYGYAFEWPLLPGEIVFVDSLLPGPYESEVRWESGSELRYDDIIVTGLEYVVSVTY
jgi:hypothetical protein